MGQSTVQAASRPQEPFSRVAPFLATALFLGVLIGFMFASLLTVSRVLHIAPGSWWTALVQAHGHVQLYGWVGLFILGVAFHFLPRVRGNPLAMPNWLPVVLVAQTASLVLRAVGQPLFLLQTTSVNSQWLSSVLLILSGLLEAFAFVSILIMFFLTGLRGPAHSQHASGGLIPYFLAAILSLTGAGIVNLINMFQAASSSGFVNPTGDDLNVTLGLFGFILPVTLAMSVRSLPMYAGLEKFPPRLLAGLAFCYLTGLIALLSSLVGSTLALSWSGLLQITGQFLIGIAIAIFIVAFLRIMSTRGKLPQHVKKLASRPEEIAQAYRQKTKDERATFGPFVAVIASAYIWAGLSACMMIINGLIQFSGFDPFFPQDSIRHALTAGFIALLLTGVSTRMIPGFSGGKITSGKLVIALLILGNLAALFRVGSLLLAPLFPGMSEWIFALSGPLGLAVAICLLINLWPAIWVSPAQKQRGDQPSPTAFVQLSTIVKKSR